MDFRKYWKLKLQGLSEGKVSKREKHRPSLEKCQKRSNRLGFVEK